MVGFVDERGRFVGGEIVWDHEVALLVEEL